MPFKDKKKAAAYKKEYAAKHKAEIKKYQQEYSVKNKEKLNEYRKEYHRSNREKLNKRHNELREQNKDRVLQRDKEWYRVRGSSLRKAWYLKQSKENIQFRLLHNLRRRLYGLLNGKRKAKKTEDLIGCTPEQLKIHLESLWSEGMSWSNYGKDGWHIDHILPPSRFDITTETAQRNLFHYTNLQPLWEYDNLKKGNKLPNELLV